MTMENLSKHTRSSRQTPGTGNLTQSDPEYERVITQDVLLNKLYARIRHEITLPELVAWAENTFVDEEIEIEGDLELLDDIIMYLAAADTRGFPLTWDVLTEFVEKLGGKMPVIIQSD